MAWTALRAPAPTGSSASRSRTAVRAAASPVNAARRWMGLRRGCPLPPPGPIPTCRLRLLRKAGQAHLERAGLARAVVGVHHDPPPWGQRHGLLHLVSEMPHHDDHSLQTCAGRGVDDVLDERPSLQFEELLRDRTL